MTVKQMKKILKRIYNSEQRLGKAIYDAKREGLIKFTNYTTESPYSSLEEMRNKLKESMAKQVFDIVISNLHDKNDA